MTECAICKAYKELMEHIEKEFRESKGYIERAFERKDFESELQEYYKGMLSMENELLYNYFTNPKELPKFWKRPIKVIELRRKLGLE